MCLYHFAFTNDYIGTLYELGLEYEKAREVRSSLSFHSSGY